MVTTFSVSTKGFTDIIDITDKVAEIASQSAVKNGLVNVFVASSTIGITTIEFDENLLIDFKAVLDEIAPYKHEWKHHQTWNDDNGGAHIRATIIGPSLTIPIVNGQIHHGAWQKIVLIDFDTRARSRNIVTTIIPS